MQLIVAEKPSVARDIARVLGVRAGGARGRLEGGERVITWCVGHLVELEEPAAYDGRWKAWRLDTLPMIPSAFKLRPVASSRDQLRVVRELMGERRFTEVVNACDAGREGELIFRYVYELVGCRLPVRRLWISSMTDEAIRDGFAGLRSGAQYDALGDAARCRSEADWLVGLNATRAVTVRHRRGEKSTLYSIGRVQTPTLAIVVGREKAIREFVPRDYWEVRGTFTRAGGEKLSALWTRGKVTRLAPLATADAVIARARAHAAGSDREGPVVERVDAKRTREPPPLLFDLTSLQRTANRRFGLSAHRTLEIAQALYETHKLLTYPRTDSRHLSADLAAELPKILRGVGQVPDYAGFVGPLLAGPIARSKRVFDDGKVQDHHAIIPTGKVARLDALDRDERRVFDLVVRRFLGAFYPDAEFASTELAIRVGAPAAAPRPAGEPDERETILEAAPPPPDRFVARGRVRLVAGWQEVAGFGDDAGKGDDAEQTLPAVTEGERLDGAFEALARQTKPPPRHNEATLLSAMETAGKTIDDEELRHAMKDTGLGTPATRAATIETLIKRGFVVREGKALAPTPLGMALVGGLPVASLASAELTGRWEARLARVARGEETRAGFMRDIEGYVREAIEVIRRAPPSAAMMGAEGAEADARRSRSTSTRTDTSTRTSTGNGKGMGLGCPRCKQGTLVTGKRGWGCSRWREGCSFVIWFETAGKRLTDAQLKDLVERGRTRKSKWTPDGGAPVAGRLVLDVNAERGAARFEAG
jgi:DNA topoisomerase-3